MCLEDIREKLTTKENFEQWLETKAPTEIVGLSFVSDACPIANYLRETFDVEPMVECDEVWINSQIVFSKNSHNLPVWMISFIDMNDARSSQRSAGGALVSDSSNKNGAGFYVRGAHHFSGEETHDTQQINRMGFKPLN